MGRHLMIGIVLLLFSFILRVRLINQETQRKQMEVNLKKKKNDDPDNKNDNKNNNNNKISFHLFNIHWLLWILMAGINFLYVYSTLDGEIPCDTGKEYVDLTRLNVSLIVFLFYLALSGKREKDFKSFYPSWMALIGTTIYLL